MSGRDIELRVLLRTPTSRDGAMAAKVLASAGIEATTCRDIDELLRELARGAGAVLLAEEMLSEPGAAHMMKVLSVQPPWSDLPILMLARQGADSNTVAGAMDALANVTVLERPMRVASLVSALRSALRARRRQYELRNHLEGLRKADQRKDEFLATLAHELRNPMAPLSTALSILRRKAPAPEAAKVYYDVMERQLEHMVRLVDDLMEVSRITRGKIELRLGSVSLHSVIRDAVELSRPLLDAGMHRLQWHEQAEHSDPLVVDGDAVRLTQVFANLLNNAAKYTPTGGMVEIMVKRQGPNAVVVIRDNGNGIAPEMLTQIFEMFVQVSDSARAAQGGLGIGLTLVRSLVELHGGSVRAQSEGLGRGTDFIVTLPLAPVAVSAGTSTGTAPKLLAPPLLFPFTVLVVDDNRDAADALAELMGLLGARAVVAYNGPAALRMAAETAPALAILDIGMPGMDGCELAGRLRADPRHEGIALVALTGWGQENDRLRVAAAGFDHHLLKPVDMAELTAILGRVADTRHGYER
jgi:signal transduction histidine kinase